MAISVFNETSFEIDMCAYKNFLKISLYVAGVFGDVSLVFVDDKYMQKLNKDFRNKDKTTDVLTFANEDEKNSGDIVISYEWIIDRYKENNYKRVIKKLIIHSILHLKGIHHDYSENSLKDNYKKMKMLYNDIVEYRKTKLLNRSNLF